MTKNKSNKVDIRIIKSKRDLKFALLMLLKTKPFEKINVFEICTTAQINRMTFYNHYQDKYDLFYDILKEWEEKLKNEYYKKVNNSPLSRDPQYCFDVACEIILDNCISSSEFLHAIIENEENAMLQYIIRNSVEKIIQESIKEWNEADKFDFSTELLTAFITGGGISIVVHWLKNKEKYPKKVFLNMLSNLFKYSVFSGKIKA